MFHQHKRKARMKEVKNNASWHIYQIRISSTTLLSRLKLKKVKNKVLTLMFGKKSFASFYFFFVDGYKSIKFLSIKQGYGFLFFWHIYHITILTQLICFIMYANKLNDWNWFAKEHETSQVPQPFFSVNCSIK